MGHALNYKTVQFLNGQRGQFVVYIVGGPCLNGAPTAYVRHLGRVVWVKPGESVEFVEVAS